MQSTLETINKQFDLTQPAANQAGPLKLAYVGDAVYELVIRTIVFDSGETSVKKMNRHAQDLVNATTQAKLAKRILPKLNEEEEGIFKRGRNTKTTSVSKHSDIKDYRVATGFESLFGYWYFSGQLERGIELLKNAIDEETNNER
ncbi:MAG: ribonuclease III [Eubacterium sp.]|nr:ribonuclease III [Eubacterium sp.]